MNIERWFVQDNKEQGSLKESFSSIETWLSDNGYDFLTRGDGKTYVFLGNRGYEFQIVFYPEGRYIQSYCITPEDEIIDENLWISEDELKRYLKSLASSFDPKRRSSNDVRESRYPRGRMLNEGIIRDSVLTPEETKQAQKAFDGYVAQILQAARDGLPGKDWVIHSGTLGNPFSRSIWAVKNYDDENRSWDDFVNLFQVSLYEDYEGGRHLFEKGYFRLVNYLEDPEEDGGYIATVSDDKIWFSDFYEDRGREPGFFAKASEYDRVEHIVKLRLKNR